MQKLSDSKNLWEQRISMVATWHFIRKGQFGPAIETAEKFLGHKHDLMHKAAGWMLRETGKAGDEGYARLIAFLDAHHKDMPRTMLRYAIERLDKNLQRHYMGKK
jgi:3-methyladenine DNA glycosylase AlkD